MTDNALPANQDDTSSAVADLSGILRESLTALAAAGLGDAACRLAGRACAALRTKHPDQWGRFNALLHRLSRVTGVVGNPQPRPHDRTDHAGRTRKAVR
jgi:hypothetical protein